MQKATIAIVVISFLALLGGAFVLSQSESGAGTTEPLVLAEKVKGNPEGEVVVVEYSDFQCPACAAFAPVVEEMLAEYGDRVRLEYRHFPLITAHPNARPAAQAAEAAGVQGKFWEMHDLLFERQSAWSSSINPQNQFANYAEELGLDVEKFRNDSNSRQIRDVVQDEMRAGREFVTGTPTILINGEKLEPLTYEGFTATIEAALGIAPEAPVSGVVEAVEFDF